MNKTLLAALVFISSTSAQAQYVSTGNWVASGILTTQNRDLGYFKTEYVELRPFDTKERCEAQVAAFAKTSESIGKGGTDRKVDGVEWNYDATCYMINPF